MEIHLQICPPFSCQKPVHPVRSLIISSKQNPEKWGEDSRIDIQTLWRYKTTKTAFLNYFKGGDKNV